MVDITKPSNLNVVWASNGDITDPGTSKIQQGWIIEAPARQHFNWLDNRQDTMLAYLNQKGIPAWDASTEYIANKSYIQGSDGNVYKCIQTGTNQNPVSATTYWVRAFDSSGYAYSKTESDNLYMKRSQNLNDVSNKATARTNLDVYSKGEIPAVVRSQFNASGSAPLFAVRSFGSFKGDNTSGSSTIYSNGNIASVETISIGVWEITLSSAIQDENYVVLPSVEGPGMAQATIHVDREFVKTPTKFRLKSFYRTGGSHTSPIGAARVNFVIVR